MQSPEMLTLDKSSVTGLPSNHSKCLPLHSPHSRPPSPNSPQRQVPVKGIFNNIIKNQINYFKKNIGKICNNTEFPKRKYFILEQEKINQPTGLHLT